jgi:hypothetical protein
VVLSAIELSQQLPVSSDGPDADSVAEPSVALTQRGAALREVAVRLENQRIAELMDELQEAIEDSKPQR